jgi:hypothetical protein
VRVNKNTGPDRFRSSRQRGAHQNVGARRRFHLRQSRHNPSHSRNISTTSRQPSRRPHDQRHCVSFDNSSKSSNEKKENGPCRFCGENSKHFRKDCPAWGKECRKCGKMNHFQDVCESPKKKVGSIFQKEEDEPIPLSFKVRGGPEQAKILSLADTGSQIDAIPEETYMIHFHNVPLRPSSAAQTATESPIPCMGTFQATIDWPKDINPSSPELTTVHVLKKLKQAVICTKTQQKLGMIYDGYFLARVNQVYTRPTPKQMKKDFDQLMAEHPRVFDGVCRIMTGPPCHFHLKEGAIPTKIRGLRPVSEPLKQPLKEELAEQVAQGILRKVPPEATTPWIQGALVDPKKNGGVRLCPDFRPLNKWLVGAKFDNPTPFQAVRSIPQGMRYFTVVDALKGYHQCALDEDSMALTTFATPEGLHQYTRLPMGICHAGDYYGRRFHDIFGHIPNTARCMEDLIIFSKTYDEHKELLQTVFKTADENNVGFNKKKTVFAAPTGKFAEYIVSENGLAPAQPGANKSHQRLPTTKQHN